MNAVSRTADLKKWVRPASFRHNVYPSKAQIFIADFMEAEIDRSANPVMAGPESVKTLSISGEMSLGIFINSISLFFFPFISKTNLSCIQLARQTDRETERQLDR